MYNDDDNNEEDQEIGSEDLDRIKDAGKAATNKAKKTAKSVVNKIKTTISSMIPPKIKLYILIAIIVIIAVIILLAAIIYLLDIDKTSKNKLKDGETEPFGYWWPIGGEAITDEDGIEDGSGTPIETQITSEYGKRDGKLHGGIDIAPVGDTTPGLIPVIAIAAGEVTYPEDKETQNYARYEGNSGTNGGYGNYIIINHGEISSLYGHLHAGSIKVQTGDSVKRGQIIAYMGNSGDSRSSNGGTGTHLHFEIRIYAEDGTYERVNPLEYVSNDASRARAEGVSILFNEKYTKEQFVKAIKKYKVPDGNSAGEISGITNKDGYEKVFIANAEKCYDIAIEYNVDPAFLFGIAVTESGYGTSSRTYNNSNPFGYETGGTATNFSGFEDAAKRVCETIKGYTESESWLAECKKRVELVGYGVPDLTVAEGIVTIYNGVSNVELGQIERGDSFGISTVKERWSAWVNNATGYMKSIYGLL